MENIHDGDNSNCYCVHVQRILDKNYNADMYIIFGNSILHHPINSDIVIVFNL